MSGNFEEDHRLKSCKRREDALRQLLTETVDKPSREIVEELKKDLGVSRATGSRRESCWNLLTQFRAG